MKPIREIGFKLLISVLIQAAEFTPLPKPAAYRLEAPGTVGSPPQPLLLEVPADSLSITRGIRAPFKAAASTVKNSSARASELFDELVSPILPINNTTTTTLGEEGSPDLIRGRRAFHLNQISVVLK